MQHGSGRVAGQYSVRMVSAGSTGTGTILRVRGRALAAAGCRLAMEVLMRRGLVKEREGRGRAWCCGEQKGSRRRRRGEEENGWMDG